MRNIPAKITIAGLIAATALVAFWTAPAIAQTPQPDLCLNVEGVQTEVPAGLVREPSGNCVVATPVPLPTPLPLVPPQVRLYQAVSCGNPVVQGDFIAGNSIWRIVVTRNGIVASNSLDLFGSVTNFYTDTVAIPGSIYRVYAFPYGTAPGMVTPGTIFESASGLIASFTAFAVPPCAPSATPTPSATATPSVLMQAIEVLSRTPTPAPAQLIVQAPASAIQPPRTGDGGLAGNPHCVGNSGNVKLGTGDGGVDKHDFAGCK